MDTIQLPTELQEKYVIYSADETYMVRTTTGIDTREDLSKVIGGAYVNSTLKEKTGKERVPVVLLHGTLRSTGLHLNRYITSVDSTEPIEPDCITQWKANVSNLIKLDTPATFVDSSASVKCARPYPSSIENTGPRIMVKSTWLGVRPTPETEERMKSLIGRDVVVAVTVNLFRSSTLSRITNKCIWIQPWINVRRELEKETDDVVALEF